jgi:methionine-S-sulfoxide reductase
MRIVSTSLLMALGMFLGCTSGEAPDPAPVAPTGTVKESGTEVDMTEKSAVTKSVVLAGGCFWGMEEILRKIPGVLETEAGYCGGEGEGVTYTIVKTGRSGHAECVRVVFDEAKLPFDQLLLWFFRMHDPTTRNRQGNDVGSQYRSAIFWVHEEHKAIAERVKKEVDASGKWSSPLVTEIVPAGPWSKAEDYHQDYLQKNPGGYTCHWLRD